MSAEPLTLAERLSALREALRKSHEIGNPVLRQRLTDLARTGTASHREWTQWQNAPPPWNDHYDFKNWGDCW